MKLQGVFAAVLFFAGILLLPQFGHALTKDDAYKGIVQISTYYQDEEKNFELVQTGTGIFLNSQGLILTNEHVVTHTDVLTGEEMPVGLRVCLTIAVDQAPDCQYSADILAKDKNKDAALLRIKASKVKQVPSYSFITRQTRTRDLKAGDSVHVWGYPGIGGRTITNTSGNYSGRESVNGVQVLKTDTTVSFGSSGGAMLNTQGELIGLISFINEDSGGTIAYAVDIEELNAWIDTHKDNSVTVTNFDNDFQNALVDFIKYDVSGTTLKFEDVGDGFSIVRSEKYAFDYTEENSLSLLPKTPENGGVVILQWFIDAIDSKHLLDQYEKAVKSLLPSCTNLGDVVVDGFSGHHLVCAVGKIELNYYFVPVKNRLFSIGFTYGVDNADLALIKSMLDSIDFDADAINFTQKTSYISPNGSFTLQTNNNWGLAARNSIEEMVDGSGKAEGNFIVMVRDTSAQKNIMSNAEYYNFVLEDDRTKSVVESVYDDHIIFDIDYNLQLNNSIKNAIRYNYEVTHNDKKTYYVAIYYVRAENNVIQVSYEHYGDNRATFVTGRTNFEQQVLAGLTVPKQLGGEVDDTATAELNIIKGSLEGQLIKGESTSAVYLLKADGKRYVFPNERVFYSWFENFDSVKTITDQELASYGLGGNLTFAPGTMIKIPSVPKVFVITRDNKIRWIETESAAKRFFGDNWNKKVKDVGASYFLNYEEIDSVK